MALQNKILPNGDIVAASMRGLFMGNRGGRIHEPRSTALLPTRRWASRQWICCVTAFKNRQRKVMGAGYTELFFLDEVTALSAGHRPCFECRRKDAIFFAESWAKAYQLESPPKAGEMDIALHAGRLDGRNKRRFVAMPEDLPDGVMVEQNGEFFALLKGKLHLWSVSGYGEGVEVPDRPAQVLTPPAIVEVLRAGFQPVWHNTSR